MFLEKSWSEALLRKTRQEDLLALQVFLKKEKEEGRVVFPNEDEIFSAFFLTPLPLVKVVIVGQDPYHGKQQAHGLSFSVKKGEKIPPSLRNIFKELFQDLGAPCPTHGFLENWAKQGVFLFNTCLTVRENEPFSHRSIGWEAFSKAVFEVLAERAEPTVFMFWGKAALHFSRIIKEKNKPQFLVLVAAHPSPLSVRGFSGCRHFSKANEFLENWGKTPINWSLEN